jgi:hypothetical protein
MERNEWMDINLHSRVIVWHLKEPREAVFNRLCNKRKIFCGPHNSTWRAAGLKPPAKSILIVNKKY